MKLKILPTIEPLIKQIPTIKLIGKLTDSVFNKYIFSFFELFCMAIINIKNKIKLNVNVKNIFFNVLKINPIFKF